MRIFTHAGPIQTQPGRAHAAEALAGFKEVARAILGICIAALLLIASFTIAANAEESIWTHNGSTVRWVSSGPDQWLYYLQPRPELLAIGVRPDTPLSKGRGLGIVWSAQRTCLVRTVHLRHIRWSESSFRRPM